MPIVSIFINSDMSCSLYVLSGFPASIADETTDQAGIDMIDRLANDPKASKYNPIPHTSSDHDTIAPSHLD